MYGLISKSVHTLIGPILYNIKNCINKNNVTRISMATKYPIIKHRAFFKTLPQHITHSYSTDSYETSPGYSSTSCAMRVTKKIEHRSKVKIKVTENTKTTI